MNELLEIAKQAALEAGAEIMKIYTDPSQDFGIEKKADNSPALRSLSRRTESLP